MKDVLKVNEVAELLELSTDDIIDIINSGDLRAVGGSKSLIRKIDFEAFLNGEINATTPSYSPVDYGRQFWYPPTHSIEIEDLTEEEWIEMSRRGKGDGSLYFNENRQTWCAVVSLGYNESGKRIRKSISGKDKEEVQKALYHLLLNGVANVETSTATQTAANKIANDILFSEYIDNYLKTVQNGTTSVTFETKFNMAKHIKEGLGSLRMSEINRQILEKFLNDFSAKKYKIGGKNNREIREYGKDAIHKVYVLLKSIINDAVENDAIIKNYMDGIKKPKCKKFIENRNKALTDEEIRTLIRAADSHDSKLIKVMVYVGLYTGMRPSEIKALQFSDIDFDKKIIKVRRTLSQDRDIDVDTGARGKRRAIIKNIKNHTEFDTENYAYRDLIVSNKVLEVIEERKQEIEKNPAYMQKRSENGTQDYIFTGNKGQLAHRDIYDQQYERMLKPLGYKYSDFNLYKLRHTYCTKAIRAKLDIKTVQMLLGDNSPDMVLRVYADMNKEDMLKGSAEMAKCMDFTLACIPTEGEE